MADFEKSGLSLGKVAKCCGVTRKTILRWVGDGLIKSFTLPSGHHRVFPEDIEYFLRSHGMPIPEGLDTIEKRRVLIVDDDENSRRLMADLLRPHFLVEEARHGIEALLAIGASPPDLLLFDINTRGIDGIIACQHIAHEERLRCMRVIVVSAHRDNEVCEILDGLVEDVIAKPFSAVGLIRSCHKALGLNVAKGLPVAVELL